MKRAIVGYFRHLKPPDIIAIITALIGVNILDIIAFFGIEDVLSPWIKVTLATFLVVAVLVFTGVRRGFREVYDFYEQSEAEAKFFQEWYSRNGTLYIYCTDLEWLEDIKYAGVVSALMTKASNKRLHIYLRDYDHQIVRDLRGRGARLYRVKPEIKSEHRFSVNINEHVYSVIIRNKKTERDKITVEEYINHRAMAYLGLDMLNDCYIPWGK